jgi:large subunit ribosomal protein L9
MAKTEVILIQNVVGLGAESDQVKVTAGYARNYLIPHRLAVPVTHANKRRLEVLRQRRAEREAHDLNTMAELGKSLSKVIVAITVKTGEDGKMFGSVTSGTIADALKTQLDVSLDKRKIHIDKAIHTLGEHELELRLHPEVRSTLKVLIKSSTPLPEQPPADEKEKREGRRTEKRGRRPLPETAAADKKTPGPAPKSPVAGPKPPVATPKPPGAGQKVEGSGSKAPASGSKPRGQGTGKPNP